MPSYEFDSPYIIADYHDVNNVSNYIQWPYGIPATLYEHAHGIVASKPAAADAFYPHTFPASQVPHQCYPSHGCPYQDGLSHMADELCAVTQISSDSLVSSNPLRSVAEEVNNWSHQGTIPVSSCFNAMIQSEGPRYDISDAHVNNAIFTVNSPVNSIYPEPEARRSRQSIVGMESPDSRSSGACDKLEPVPPHMIVPSQHHLASLLPKQPAVGQLPGLDGPNTPDSYPYDSPSPQTPGFPSASFSSAETGSSTNLPFDFEHEGDEYANHQAQYPSRREVFSTFTSALKDALNEAKVESSPVRIKDVVKFDVQQPSDPRHSLLRISSAKSPRLAGAPYPTSSARRSSPSLTKKSADEKPPLACLFCRRRKIACGAPTPGSTDRTCNQCGRRQLMCEYPLESRRGMRKKKAEIASATGHKISTKAVLSD